VVIGETSEEIEATKSHSEVVEDGRTVLVPMQEVKDSTTKTNNTLKANKLKQLMMMRILTIITKWREVPNVVAIEMNNAEEEATEVPDMEMKENRRREFHLGLRAKR